MLHPGGDYPVTAHSMVSQSFLQSILYWIFWKQGSTSAAGVAGLTGAILATMKVKARANLAGKAQGMLRGSRAALLPHAVEDVPIGEHPQHDVVRGGIMDEGPLGMHKEDIGDPDLLHQPAIKGHALVVGAGKRETLILPVVP